MFLYSARFTQKNVLHQTGRFFTYQGWNDFHGSEKTLLGEYVYDHKGYALQSFPVQVRTKENDIFEIDCFVNTMQYGFMFFAPSLTGVDCEQFLANQESVRACVRACVRASVTCEL